MSIETMSIETVEPGLRERKRRATRRAIQFAAITLVRDNGLERLTVDEIGRVADISPRTFFNYFPTKEAALIGDGPGLPSDESITGFVEGASGQSLLSDIATLLTEATDLAAADRELTQLRRVVLKQHPQLFGMRMATMKHFEDDMQAVVLRRLVHDKVQLSDDALASRARLITLVAAAAMRHAWVCWADGAGGSDLARQLRESFAELEVLLASTPAR